MPFLSDCYSAGQGHPFTSHTAFPCGRHLGLTGLLVLDRAQQPSGGRAQGFSLGGISQGPRGCQGDVGDWKKSSLPSVKALC